MANLIYRVLETAQTWQDSAGDHTMTLDFLDSDAGRQGATWDRTAADGSRWFRWRFWCEFDSTTPPVLGEQVRVYLKTSDDNTVWDNDDTTGDTAVSVEDKLRNLQLLGVLQVDQATADIVMSVSGDVEITSRYVAPVVWNATADRLDTTTNSSGFSLTPVPDEIQ